MRRTSVWGFVAVVALPGAACAPVHYRMVVAVDTADAKLCQRGPDAPRLKMSIANDALVWRFQNDCTKKVRVRVTEVQMSGQPGLSCITNPIVDAGAPLMPFNKDFDLMPKARAHFYCSATAKAGYKAKVCTVNPETDKCLDNTDPLTYQLEVETVP
jgi:hypothetical protein